MKALLVAPQLDKGWSLQFFEVPTDKQIRSNIWAWSLHYGKLFHVRPFLQGDFSDWMMIEFFSNVESNILGASIKICEHLKINLDF